MQCKNNSTVGNSLKNLPMNKNFPRKPPIQQPDSRNSVLDSPWSIKPLQSDPSISFINDVSTLHHSMVMDPRDPQLNTTFSGNLEKSEKSKKKLKKPNKIIGFFKKIFKSKQKKKRKKEKGHDIKLQESFLSSTSTRPAMTFTQSKVDFTKDEIFSNE
jgi:hypothetical protein